MLGKKWKSVEGCWRWCLMGGMIPSICCNLCVLSVKLQIFTVIAVRLNKHISPLPWLGRSSGLLSRHFLFEESKRSSQHRHLPHRSPVVTPTVSLQKYSRKCVSSSQLWALLGWRLTNQDFAKFPSKLCV